jgi:hypothetical protein
MGGFVNSDSPSSRDMVGSMSISGAIEPDQSSALGRPIAFRLTEDERHRLLRLARLRDRTPGSEVRRAVRYYLANVETVDHELQRQAEATP